MESHRTNQQPPKHQVQFSPLSAYFVIVSSPCVSISMDFMVKSEVNKNVTLIIYGNILNMINNIIAPNFSTI